MPSPPDATPPPALGPDTTIGELIDRYPFLVDFMPTISSRFAKLQNPILRRVRAPFATLRKVARVGGVELSELQSRIAAEIESRTGEAVEIRVE